MRDETNDEIVDDSTAPPSDAEVEEQQADPRDKQLKDRQAEITRLQQERAELKSSMDQLKGQVEVLAKVREAPPAEQPNPFAEVDDEEYWKDYFDSPEKARKLHQKQIEVFGHTILTDRQKREALEARVAEMGKELTALRAGVNKPDPALESKISKLRENPDFAAMPDEMLAKVAKLVPDAPEFGGGPPSAGRVPPKAGKGPRFSDATQKAAYEKMRLEAGW